MGNLLLRPSNETSGGGTPEEEESSLSEADLSKFDILTDEWSID